MLRSVRSVALGVVCGVVGIAAVVVALGQQGFAPSSGGASALMAERLSADALVVPGVRWLTGDEQVANREQARHASPQALFARQASRTAYEHLGERRAIELSRAAFPGVVEHPNGGSLELPAGERIARYISSNAATIVAPGGRHAVIESLEPIARREGAGRFAALNLSLTDAGGAYVPASSTLDVRIPKHLRDGVRLPDSGVSMTPSDSHGAPLSGSEGSVEGSSVIYANTQTDADTLAKPAANGFEVDVMLRSVASPTRLRFRVGLPAGAKLEQEGRSNAVRVVRGGRALGTILAPSAQDAAGSAVPVSMSAVGDTLALSVDVHSSEYQYPVLVDPSYVVTDEQLTGFGKPTHWKFCATGNDKCVGHESNPYFSSGWGNSSGGLTVKTSTIYNEPEYAALAYQTQGESKIYKVTGEASGSDANGNVESDAQLTTEALFKEKKYEDNQVLATHPATSYTKVPILVCPKLENGEHNCNAGAGVAKSAFYFLNSGINPGGTGFTDTLLKASVFIAQPNRPTVTFDKEHSEVGGQENVLYGSGRWLGPSSGAYKMIVEDKGIGISYYAISAPGTTWSVKHKVFEDGLCEGVQCLQTRDETFTWNSSLPDGEDLVEVTAQNAMAESLVSGSEHVKVDATKPYGLALTGLPGSGEVNEQPYHLRAQATDGSGSTPSSGIRSIVLTVDGKELQGGHAGSCTPGPCVAGGEWTLSGEGLGAGEHQLEVVATDKAGNVETKEYPFTVRHAEALGAGPGSVNPTTGSLSLSATDVSIGGGLGSLAFSRTYNSRRLTAGAEGPLGPQWSLSIGAEQKLEKTSSGSVVLIGASDDLTEFKSLGFGKFESPEGDGNLVLSEVKEGTETKEFLLKDPQAGTTVHFTLAVGATSGLYYPSLSEGVLATGTQSYIFKTVEVEGKTITEPTLALAPAPAGVSCGTLIRGCRALGFKYATSTTATGEAASQWGSYNGRLKEVIFTAYNPTSKAMQETAVASYLYDAQGRLRAEWDPRISPSLKTTYGYDSEGHVVSLNPPGQQPSLFHYGALAGDSGTGRLLSVISPPASASIESNPLPSNTSAPSLSTLTPVVGVTLSISSNGSWSNSPLAYTYQWEDCNSSGGECVPIAGAVNQSYTPQARDAGYKLVGQVIALNGDGAGTGVTVASGTLVLTSPSFSLAFGSFGSEVGKFSKPVGDAIDSGGNVWVADSANNRIEKFNSSGGSPVAYGTVGSGNLQFKTPAGIAISPEGGNIYIADKGNNRIEELNGNAEFVRAFGQVGTGVGQLKEPQGVAIDGLGDVWVADSANNRVEEFSATGVFMGSFGSLGSGNGQFKTPVGVAVCGEYVYVTDQGNNRVQKLSLAGAYVSQFGSSGTGNGQFSAPSAIATDPLSGDLVVADRGNGRTETFNPAGIFLHSYGSKGTGNGQFTEPEGLAINSSGEQYVVDTANNRVQKLKHSYSTNNPAPSPPSVGSNAVTTFEYGVPVSGAGAPYELGKTEAAAWAQTDVPTEATAVFPPDTPEGWPAQAYTRASITYLDPAGHVVNVAAPGGAIATSEYNETNNVVRSLSAANRAAALNEGANSATVSKTLDTQSTYNLEGTELLEALGPEHKVKLASGSETKARARKVYSYDEGAPEEGGPYRLVTKTVSGAKYSGGEADVHTTTTSYSGQYNLGWKLRKPTSTTVDPAGLKLTTTTIYDSATGNVTETRSPGAGPANGPVGAFAYTTQVNTWPTSLKQPNGAARDSNNNLWITDTENNRVDEYSPTGEYMTGFGSEGTGNGQFKKPEGLAVDSSGNVWVADTGNNRIEEFSSTGEFLFAFGTEGSGNGQLKAPWDVAVLSGYVWVADAGNNRVQKFSTAGVYQSQFGSEGSGNGQFLATQAGVTYGMWLVNNTGVIWVTDYLNNRVEQFSLAGGYLTKFGTAGSGNGQLSHPEDLAADYSGGHVWVVDRGNSRVEEFSATGSYVTKFGAEGAGNGQFKQPAGIALDSSYTHLWVADTVNNRVQQFTPGGEYLRNVSTWPTSLKQPNGAAVDSSGHLWITDTVNSRVDEYSSTGEFMIGFGTEGSGNGQFKKPEGLAVDSSGHVWVADTGNNRIEELSTAGAFIKAFGTEGTGNGQFKKPWDVALDSGGNIWVTDAGNNRVQKFTSAGAYSSQFGSEGTGNGQFLATQSGVTHGMWLVIDSGSNLWVTDYLNNRVQKFNSSGVYQSKFGTEGSGNGQLLYPEGIALDSGGHLFVVDHGNNRVEEFSSAGAYMTQFGVEGKGNGQLHLPAGIAIDSSTNIWVADTLNNRVEQFALANASPGVTQTVYYSAGANTAYPQCGEHAEWANLVCQTQPAVQPAPSVAPALPVTKVTYNIWEEAETTTETVGTTTRTKTTTYDTAGRELTAAITSTVGTTLPTTKNEYNETTGALVKQSTTVGETTRTITSVFNTLGQLTSYTDADGNAATYKYTLDGQVEEMSDGKGTQIYAYDPTTQALNKLLDSAAGTFTATYDVEGKLTTEGYPNGMNANTTYNTAGQATGIEYVKTTHCTEKCTWYSETATPAIGGETLSTTSTLANDAYAYDTTGRLTQTQETPAGTGCKTRVYAYDIESNRTGLTSREPGAEGKCATEGGTLEKHTYDEANRLIDTGVSYDTFGDTTKLPAADAGGNEVTSTYYTSSQLQSQTQNGQTLTYNLDPSGRVRETITTGSTNSTVISHYAGSASSPIWTSESAEKWTRNIPGIDGALGATQKNGETPILQLHDLQGNVIATAALSETETKLLSSYNSTEFGVPTTSSPPKYSWLGASGVATELPSGITNTNTTSYIPQLGRTLQTEPIIPPGATPDGTFTGTPYVSQMEPWVGQAIAAWAGGGAERQAAQQQAAAREAIEKTLVGDGDDPTVYYDWWQARDKGYKLGHLGLAGQLALFVGDIGAAPLELLVSVLQDRFNGVDVMEKWFSTTARNLVGCAAALHFFFPTSRRAGCRFSWFAWHIHIQVPIVGWTILDTSIVNFFRRAKVSLCINPHLYCIPVKVPEPKPPLLM